jgi:hypothetical protein
VRIVESHEQNMCRVVHVNFSSALRFIHAIGFVQFRTSCDVLAILLQVMSGTVCPAATGELDTVIELSASGVSWNCWNPPKFRFTPSMSVLCLQRARDILKNTVDECTDMHVMYDFWKL